MTIDITTYSKEFTAITAALLRDEKGVVKRFKKGSFLCVDKATLLEMLNKKAYAAADSKLKIWRDLRWIDTDGEHLTRNVSLNKKRVRMVEINLQVHETLPLLLEKTAPPPAPLEKADTGEKNQETPAKTAPSVFGHKKTN